MAGLWKHFNNLHLRAKLMISYLAVILILVLFWGGSSYAQMNTQISMIAEKDFSNLASSACTLIQNKAERAERALLVMARDSRIIEMFCSPSLTPYQQADMIINHFDPLLANINEQNEYISRVVVFTAGGLQNARHYILDIRDLTESERLLTECSSEPTWQFTGDTLAVSCKLAGVDLGADTASVSFILDTEKFFSDCVHGSSMDYLMQIRDKNGSLIYEYASIANEQAWQECAQPMEYRSDYSRPGWTVCFYANPLTQSVPAQVTIRTTMIAVMVALMLIFPLMLLMSHGFSRRIHDLKEKVEQIVPSHYEMEISSPDKDEIGEITNTIGDMVRDSRQRILKSYQESINQRDAKIQALQAQINPHFLYNTLSNLNWRAIRSGDMEMSRLLNAMSKFYRMTLNKGKILSTIGEELEHARLYMRIQCAIHNGEPAEEVYEVSEDLIDYHIPTLILQPLVENAVEHGFGSIGFENGKLGISVGLEDGQIVIRVSDNGVGISKEAAAAVLDPQEESAPGYGLRNVYHRLRLLFEDEFSMSFETGESGGTSVVIRVPPYVQP